MKTLVLILVAVVCVGCGVDSSVVDDHTKASEMLYQAGRVMWECDSLNAVKDARIDRLAADSAYYSMADRDWAVETDGDTIYYYGVLDSIHPADDQKWLSAVNMRLIRLAADSARCVR